MYSVVPPHKLHESIRAYIDSSVADSIGFDEKNKCYTVKRVDGYQMKYGGLLSKLRSLFYPYYKNSRRSHKTQKKGSNSKLGMRIDDEIRMVTASKRYDQRKGKGRIQSFHKMTMRILKEVITERGHVLQCAQLPVMINALDRITQVDFITLNQKTGRLHMWELKTGFTPGMYTTRGKGHFSSSFLEDIQCTKYGIWELQRYWTARALTEVGIDIAESNVINIYEDTKKKKYVVKVLDNLPWTLKLDAFGETTSTREATNRRAPPPPPPKKRKRKSSARKAPKKRKK